MIPDGEIPMYCATCSFALDVVSGKSGSQSYVHTDSVLRHHRLRGIEPHDPDAVPIETLASPVVLCDFDSEVPATYLYVCASRVVTHTKIEAQHYRLSDYRRRHLAARVTRVETGEKLTTDQGTVWAACEPCAALIEARDVLGLVGRAVESLPAKYVAGRRLIEVRGRFITDFEEMFATLESPRRRLEPGHPLGIPESID